MFKIFLKRCTRKGANLDMVLLAYYNHYMSNTNTK